MKRTVDKRAGNDQVLTPSRRRFFVTSAMVGLGFVVSNNSAAEQKRPLKSGFVPPNAEKRRKAIGSLAGVSPQSKRAFDPAENFEPMTTPEAGDWLAEHKERGRRSVRPVRGGAFPVDLDGRRSTIYLVPFGDFDLEWSPKNAGSGRRRECIFPRPR